jgi:hypothetical protein
VVERRVVKMLIQVHLEEMVVQVVEMDIEEVPQVQEINLL